MNFSDISYDAKTGSPHNKGYLVIGMNEKIYLAHRLAWYMHFNVWPLGQIDHKNGDKTDNRIENLRIATDQQNRFNTGLRVDNRSGVTGVCWIKTMKCWRAGIHSNRKFVHLGYFASKDDAISTRKAAEEKYAGEFAYKGTE